MKRHLRKGFSLAELGIALVILFIVSTIATISYFTIIDNAKEVKIIEDTETLQLALARQEVNIKDYSTEYNISDLDQEIQDILAYHSNIGTNLTGVVFPNKVILNSDGEYILGELKVNKNVLDNNGFIGDILNINKVIAKEIDVLDLKVRKLDNNKVNKLISNSLEGEWFLVSDYQSNNKLDNVDNITDKKGSFLEEVVRLTEKEAKEQGYTIIKNAEELNTLVRDNLDGKFILMDDIDLSDYSEGEGWDPIGHGIHLTGDTFIGEFNGNGYVIRNLTINRANDTYVGLFGRVEEGKIINLGLEGVTIEGNYSVGGLAGTIISKSIISNSYVIGDIIGHDARIFATGGLVGISSGSTINSSFTNGSVKGEHKVGGLVGIVMGSGSVVSNSYSLSSVIGDMDVGGLVGRNAAKSSITQSYYLGNVKGNMTVGSLVGDNDNSSAISNSYAGGSVNGNYNVGGLVGLNINNSTIRDSYSSSSVSGSKNSVGGIEGRNELSNVRNSYFDKDKIGDNVLSGVEGKTTIEMKTKDTFRYWDFNNIWTIDEGNDYPRLRWEK